jgi:hypothetical protein
MRSKLAPAATRRIDSWRSLKSASITIRVDVKPTRFARDRIALTTGVARFASLRLHYVKVLSLDSLCRQSNVMGKFTGAAAGVFGNADRVCSSSRRRTYHAFCFQAGRMKISMKMVARCRQHCFASGFLGRNAAGKRVYCASPISRARSCARLRAVLETIPDGRTSPRRGYGGDAKDVPRSAVEQSAPRQPLARGDARKRFRFWEATLRIRGFKHVANDANDILAALALSGCGKRLLGAAMFAGMQLHDLTPRRLGFRSVGPALGTHPTSIRLADCRSSVLMAGCLPSHHHG